jgi:hypothetical protein
MKIKFILKKKGIEFIPLKIVITIGSKFRLKIREIQIQNLKEKIHKSD